MCVCAIAMCQINCDDDNSSDEEKKNKKEERKSYLKIVKNGFVGSTHMHMCGAHMWDIEEGPPSLHKIPRSF